MFGFRSGWFDQGAGGLPERGPQRGLAAGVVGVRGTDVVEALVQQGLVGRQRLDEVALVRGGVEGEALGGTGRGDPLASGVLRRGQGAGLVHGLGRVEDQGGARRHGLVQELGARDLGLCTVDGDGGRLPTRAGGEVDDTGLAGGGVVAGTDAPDLRERLVGRLRRPGRSKGEHGEDDRDRGQPRDLHATGGHWPPTARREKPSGVKTSWPSRMPRSASFSANFGRTPVALRWPLNRPCSSTPMP